MAEYFSKKTFDYFDGARKNSNKKKWFEANEDLYLEHVREPLSSMVSLLHKELALDLRGIEINPKKISRPLRVGQRAIEQGLIKTHAHITLWEKKSSLFEWNPGLHIQVGHKSDDNFIGLGLYMVSSRQLSLLRDRCVHDYEQIDSLLTNKKLVKAWGQLMGERYKRFPKGFDANQENTKYLWHKKFFLGKELSRKDVCSKDFIKKSVAEFKLAMPFFKWVRQAVGTYSR
jgi:uncharacterized protein (TIGR02453 family)